MGAPGFLGRSRTLAAKVGAEHTRTQRRLETFTKLQSDAEDLEGLAELADEDPEIAEGVGEALDSVETRLTDGRGAAAVHRRL